MPVLGSRIESGREPVRTLKLSMNASLLVRLRDVPGSCLICTPTLVGSSSELTISSEASVAVSSAIAPVGSKTSKKDVLAASSDDGVSSTTL